MAIISMVIGDVAKWVAYGEIVVNEIHGMNNQASTVYIQLFDLFPLTTTPTTMITSGARPSFKSLQVLANAPFAFTLPAVTLSQLVIGLSTSETTYAAVAANGGLDMSLTVDSQYLVDGTEVIVGDQVTGVDSLVVWTNSVNNAGFRLLRIDYVNNDAVTRYLDIWSSNIGTNYPPICIQTTAGITVTRTFGRGINLQGRLATTNALFYDLNMTQSSTPGPITPTATVTSYMRAMYHP